MSDNTHASTAVFRRTTSRERANFGFSRTSFAVGGGIDRKDLGSQPSSIKPSGGARRDRTDDLLLAKQALSQLSYGPFQRSAVSTSHQKVLGHQNPEGAADQHHASAPLRRHAATEPTPFMTDRRWLIFGSWWAWEDLNFRPHAYQARALTN